MSHYPQPASYTLRWPLERDGALWASRYAQASLAVMEQGGGVSRARVEAMRAAVSDHAAFGALDDREKLVVRILRMGQRLEAMLLALTEAQVAIDNPSEFLRIFNDDLSRMQALILSVNNAQQARANPKLLGEVLVGPTTQSEVAALEEVLTTTFHRFDLKDGVWLFSPGTPKEWKIQGASSPSVDVALLKKGAPEASLFFSTQPGTYQSKEHP
jgi:hypothetical protein